MVTDVIVNAQVSSDKQILVRVIEDGVTVEQFTVQDGETIARLVYENRQVIIEEVDKV